MQLSDAVDDFSFLRGDGSSLMMSAFAGKPLVLIFLRHLA